MKANISNEAWEIIDQVEAAELTAQRLKAVTCAFGELFARRTPDENVKAVECTPELFSNLFSVMELFVLNMNDAMAAVSAACDKYMAQEKVKEAK